MSAGNSIPWRRSTDPQSPTFEPTALIVMDGKEYYVHLNVATKLIALERAASDLVSALDTCEPHINNAFTFCHVHGQRYTGPTYNEQLDSLRSVLSPPPSQGTQEKP